MLLLASKSPRRQELIKMLDLPFKVVSIGDVEEVYPSGLKSEEVPSFLSRLKSDSYKDRLQEGDILITADTIVLLDNSIIGKPHDMEDAKRMLSMLSGKKHKVITGVTLAATDKTKTFSAVTDVYFGSLTPRQIDYYVEKYRPLDKAGAYGIQEWIGAVGIERIDGSFYNVMGLPVRRLYDELKHFDIKL